MDKKIKNVSTPKITKVKVIGKLDSITDILKQKLFEYSPQSIDELVHEVQVLLVNQKPTKIIKNINRCLTKNPCFRSEGRGLWCLRLDGVKENDVVHRTLQSQGDALRLNKINQRLSESGKPGTAREQRLVTDGRFLRLKDGRWGLIYWSYMEPKKTKEAGAKKQEVAATVAANSRNVAETNTKGKKLSLGPAPKNKKTGKIEEKKLGDNLILPLARPTPIPQQKNFWEKLFPLKDDQEKTPLPLTPPQEPTGWREIAAGAETASMSLEVEKPPCPPQELSLINGGKNETQRPLDKKEEEKRKLLRELVDLRKENKNLLSDLEKLYRRREENRQELLQVEEQLINLRIERDAGKKRITHLETRLMQLQGTLNKTVSDAQAEQSRLKQQLREQEYRLQTTLIANEDLEQTVAELQRERQGLKRQLSFLPVRLVLRLFFLFGFRPYRESAGSKTYSRY